jgi:phosphate transport system protein
MTSRKELFIQDTLNAFREMADLVLAQLNLIEKAMLTDESAQAGIMEEIENNEAKIDKYEVTINDKFINTIVLYQPVASEIRNLVAVYRMTINLERIGDLVVNIKNALASLKERDEYRVMSDVILNMLQSGKIMVEKSLLSFVNSDQDFAIWTIKNDKVVDEMNNKLIANSIAKSDFDRTTKDMLLSYIEIKNIISNIERIADHATNIAEATIYSLKGTDVRHSGFEKEQE